MVRKCALLVSVLLLATACAKPKPVIFERKVPAAQSTPVPAVQPAGKEPAAAFTGGVALLPPPVAGSNEVDRACSYFYFTWSRWAENSERYDEALDALRKALLCDPQSVHLKRSLAYLLLRQNQGEEAAQLLESLLEVESGARDDRLLLAKVYARLGRSPEAERHFKELLDGGSGDEEVLLLLSVLYLSDGSYQDAEEALRKIVALKPDAVDGYYYLARLYRERNLPLKARDAYEAAAARGWSLRLATEMASFYEEQGWVDEAASVYRRMLAQDNGNEALRMKLVSLYYRAGLTRQALAELQALRGSATEPGKIDLAIARLLLSEERAEEAAGVLEPLLAREPGNTAALYLMANVALLRKKSGEARQLLNLIPAATEEFEGAALLQIRILQEDEGPAAAVRYAIALLADQETRRPLFYSVLAELYRDLGQTEAGRQALDEGLRSYPDNPELLYDYGLFLERLGDRPGALEKMEQVLEHDPLNASALNFIGYCWAERGENLEQALEYIEKAVALQPADGFIRDSLGWVHYMLGNYEEARYQLERAVVLVEDDPTIYEHLGDVYLMTAEPVKAGEVYRKAMELYEEEEKREAVRRKLDGLVLP